MADLKQCFIDAGYLDASTYLQSGNVLFSHDGVTSAELEAVLEKRFGFPIPVILRSKAELDEILRVAPFDPGDDDHSHQFIALLKEPFEGDLPPDPPKGGCAYLGKTEREIFSRWWQVNGKYEVPSTPKSLKHATTRNRRVLQAIAEML